MILIAPFTAVLLLSLNFYVKHWAYGLFVACFSLIYSGLWGLLFCSYALVPWIFLLLIVVFLFKMKKLSAKIKGGSQDYPILVGDIQAKKHDFYLAFGLSFRFFRFLRFVPVVVGKNGKGVKISELFEALMCGSVGTTVNIVCDEATVNLEIK